MSGLVEQPFIDLYLSEDYSDMRGLPGQATHRMPVPSEYVQECAEIRAACVEMQRREEEPEFALVMKGRMFRVTTIRDVRGQDVFVLRRSDTQLREISQLGLTPKLVDLIHSRSAHGIVLCVGEMSSGKSSTIASMLSSRLRTVGGIAIAIEDPPETDLNCEHGLGRCIQIRASKKNGGYKEQLVRAVRSGAQTILIGEVRDGDTALQMVQSGINGHLILGTMHAGSIQQGIERLISLARERAPNAADLVASGLAAICHLSLVPSPDGTKNILKCNTLILDDESTGVRSQIRTGKFAGVQDAADQQSRQTTWQKPQVPLGSRRNT